MGPVHTGMKKKRWAELMEWAEKAAVAPDTHQSHMNQAQNNSLSGGKKIHTTSALLSSDITGWEESIRLSKTKGYKQ